MKRIAPLFCGILFRHRGHAYRNTRHPVKVPHRTDASDQTSGDVRQAPEKPSEAPEKPTGEKPADAPEEPADAPEMPAGEQGVRPADGQQGPRMIDFDAMVTKGVISQETREKIKTYMDEHKPEGEPPVAPAEGQAPGDGQQPPEEPEGEMPTDGEKPADAPELPADGQQPDLLSDLLSAGIITQAEYDALSAAITVLFSPM